jgi:hypothetical protein
MNAETAFAMTLGDDEQEKLAAHFDAYSADELADLLMEKSAVSDEYVRAKAMLSERAGGRKYYDIRRGEKVHVSHNFKTGKTVETRGVDVPNTYVKPSRRSPDAGVFDKAKAHARVGATKLKGLIKRNPKTAMGAGLAMVAGGTALALRKKPEEKTVQSSAEIADIWGRELAREDIEKTAGPFSRVGAAAQRVGRAGKAVGRAAAEQLRTPATAGHVAAGVGVITGANALRDREKTAFAVTEEGHKADAARSRIRERHAAEMLAHGQAQRAIASKKEDGGYVAPKFTRVLRGFGPKAQEFASLRHHAYTAKKHEKGQNAYNPFGGAMTPSKYERSGGVMTWGKSIAHPKEKAATGLGSPLGTGALGPKPPGVKPPGAATMGVAKPGSVGGAPKIASVTKEAFLGAMAAKAAPLLAKAMPAVQRVAQSTVGQAAAGGAIVGGGVNAARHLMKPKDPQTGQRQGSMLGAVAKGAVGGAVGGLGARALAQKFGPGMQVAAWKQGPKMLPPAASAAPQLPPGPAQRNGPPRGGPASGQVIDVPFKTVNASARLSGGSVNNPFR